MLVVTLLVCFSLGWLNEVNWIGCNLIRQLLRRYKYPPDGQRQAIDLVLLQAETLSQSWMAGD